MEMMRLIAIIIIHEVRVIGLVEIYPSNLMIHQLIQISMIVIVIMDLQHVVLGLTGVQIRVKVVSRRKKLILR